MVRVSLENEDDDTKTTALDVFKMLNEMLEDPEFMKNEGYAEFKKRSLPISIRFQAPREIMGSPNSVRFLKAPATMYLVP